MCRHANSVIDQHTATLVCLDCALVLEENTNICLGSSRDPECYHNIGGGKKREKQRSELYFMAQDVCENFHIPRGFIDRIVFKAQSMLCGFGRGMVLAALAMAIYSVCMEENVSRTLHDVVEATGCDREKLLRLEKKFGFAAEKTDVSAQTDRYCSFLDCSYRETLELKKKICVLLENCETQPKTIIAACISKYANKPVSEVVKIVPVSAKGVYNFKKTHLNK